MILVCAATASEADACRRGIAESGVRGVSVLRTGVGPARAAAALAARLAGGHPALVVSAGFAGALGPGLEPLTWITASALYRARDQRAVALTLGPGLLRVVPGAAACHVVTPDQVAGPGAAQGVPAPAVVDMESAALAEGAAAGGVPFAVLRVVTDAPEHPLPAVARSVAAALAATSAAARAVRVAEASLAAVRRPLAAARLARDGLRWRVALRDGWRERAAALAGL